MAISIKAAQLEAARAAIKAFPSVAMKPGYRLGRIADTLDREIKTLTKEKRKLFVELGEPLNGNMVILTKNNDEYHRRLEELLDLDITLPHEPIKLDQVATTSDDKPVDIRPEILAALTGIIVD